MTAEKDKRTQNRNRTDRGLEMPIVRLILQSKRGLLRLCRYGGAALLQVGE